MPTFTYTACKPKDDITLSLQWENPKQLREQHKRAPMIARLVGHTFAWRISDQFTRKSGLHLVPLNSEGVITKPAINVISIDSMNTLWYDSDHLHIKEYVCCIWTSYYLLIASRLAYKTLDLAQVSKLLNLARIPQTSLIGIQLEMERKAGSQKLICHCAHLLRKPVPLLLILCLSSQFKILTFCIPGETSFPKLGVSLKIKKNGVMKEV